MPTLKGVSPLIVLVAAAVAGYMGSSNSRTRLIAEFRLAPVQITLMQACETSFRASGRAFDPAIGVARGCGCFARQIARTNPAADYAATAAALHALVNLESASDGGHAVRELRIADAHGTVDHNAALRQIGPSIAAMSHCTDPLNHMTLDARNEFQRRMRDSSRG